MLKAIRFSIMIFLLFGLGYPLAMTALGQWLFPRQANGSLIFNQQHQVIGSELIGQAFAQPQYFHPRPSAAGNGYDASNSGGSNYGATSQKLIDRVKADVATYQKLNAVEQVPQEAVTASASGLDPDISLSDALLQAPRVAKTRNIPVQQVIDQVQRQTKHGLFNPTPYVNVLKLNLTLDTATAGRF